MFSHWKFIKAHFLSSIYIYKQLLHPRFGLMKWNRFAVFLDTALSDYPGDHVFLVYGNHDLMSTLRLSHFCSQNENSCWKIQPAYELLIDKKSSERGELLWFHIFRGSQLRSPDSEHERVSIFRVWNIIIAQEPFLEKEKTSATGEFPAFLHKKLNHNFEFTGLTTILFLNVLTYSRATVTKHIYIVNCPCLQKLIFSPFETVNIFSLVSTRVHHKYFKWNN